MDSDCYAILGVSRDANLSQIRRAFRTRFRQLRPESAGMTDDAVFAKLRGAYDTLRDAARRADHDDHLLASESAPDAARPAHGTPLLPAMNLFHSFDRYEPSRDDVLREFMDNYMGRLPKSRVVHALNVEVVLTPAGARAGGVVPFDVPVARPCHLCDGTGHTGFFHCDACDGHGVSWSIAQVDVIVPGGASDGTVLPLSLRHLGVHTMHLNLQIRVVDAPP